MTYTSPRRPQLFYTTAPMPCPYVSGRMERKVVTDIGGPDAERLHNRLSRAGFRRSHTIAYAPVCPSCNACVPIRVPVATFSPDRTQRRTLRRNATIEGFEVPAHATTEQFVLFQRYQFARHAEGDMAAMNFYDYRAMIEDTPVDTAMVEFRTPEDQLVCVSLIDRLDDGLSAVYSFYDPGMEEHSLGSYAIMHLITYAGRLGLPYLYLGYWIRDSAKMAYKSRFRPAEILHHGSWTALDPANLPANGGSATRFPIGLPE
ncbi:arginyltransferase [Gluconacetobacter asukensis]|uniref:Aspartate/glutamate leucyltransferase n=1 Tax=Gluconacetobacter asukensis TaxID=1017181 RepID=A0A7W4J049_9PROT|nr:arginyltransferase [Gluconacetobacter asukensis]MBB2172254.1 arginyltransferase [Gluconacetobacter asukensis]